MRGLILLLAALIPLSSSADGLPFLKDLAGDADLPRPWGVGFDFFTMDQDYDIKNLEFALPGVTIGDPSQIKVTNEVKHYDIQADAWILPFLNVFGLGGRVSIDTAVDFSDADVMGLPFPLGTLPVSFNGTVWGGGFTLAYGTERWFTTVTTTFTRTSTSGDLDSKVSSTSVQPRIGLLKNGWRFWVGGMYLDTDEKHEGVFDLGLPGLNAVPFAVELQTKDSWNYTVGAGYEFNDRFNLSFEAGFGNRTHSLFNLNFRF